MTERKTRIVATIAPHTVQRILKLDDNQIPDGSQVGAVLSELAKAGVDVLRLNMSFRNDVFIEHVFRWFQDHYLDEAKNVAVLGDLQGPKLRLGTLNEIDYGTEGKGIRLETGKKYRLYYREDRKAGITLSTVGNSEYATVLLDRKLFETLGDCVKRGFADRVSEARTAKPIEIAVGDGNVIFVIPDESFVFPTHLLCRVAVGGLIESEKGIMPKAIRVDVPKILTDKDINDLRFLMRTGTRFVSFLALSFVKGPMDLLRVKEELKKFSTYQKHLRSRINAIAVKEDRRNRGDVLKRTLPPAIIAKIETIEAVEPKTLQSIIDVADGVMVARGDLALQKDSEDVPWEQKDIIKLCRLRGKPVITATQMLHSMENFPRPTRSEVNDVFNAVLDGTDATMLSGETSQGKYPLDAVRTMSRILAVAEGYYQATRPDKAVEWAEMRKSLNGVVKEARQRLEMVQTDLATSEESSSNQLLRAIITSIYSEKISKTIRQPTTDMVCMSAWAMVSSPELVAIVAATTSGRTARMLARYRPDIPIFGATHDDENRRKLMLSYGVRPIDIGLGATSTEELYAAILSKLRSEHYLRAASGQKVMRDLVLMVSGEPLGDPGSTNQMKLVSLRALGFELCDC
jgi:pyruvate kinase